MHLAAPCQADLKKRLLTPGHLTEDNQVHEDQGARIFALNSVYEFLRIEVPNLNKRVVRASRRKDKWIIFVIVSTDCEDTVLIAVSLGLLEVVLS